MCRSKILWTGPKWSKIFGLNSKLFKQDQKIIFYQLNLLFDPFPKIFGAVNQSVMSKSLDIQKDQAKRIEGKGFRKPLRYLMVGNPFPNSIMSY